MILAWFVYFSAFNIAKGYLPPQIKNVIFSRIVGGEMTAIEKIPYQAALLQFKVHRCGASIISPTIAITAAHCTADAFPKRLSIRAGTSYRNTGGVVVKVTKFVNHPRYDAESNEYDLAVLWLENPLEFGKKIQPIELIASNETIWPGSIGIVSGWGRLFEGSTRPEVLRSVAVPIIDPADCVSISNITITESMICAGVEDGGKDACQQDSGGPMAVNGTLVGVISWAVGCGRANRPGVYARISIMREWIDEVIKQG